MYPITYTQFACSSVSEEFSIYTIIDKIEFNTKKDIYIKFVTANMPTLNIYLNNVLFSTINSTSTNFEDIFVFTLNVPSINTISNNNKWTKGTYLLEFTDSNSYYYNTVELVSSVQNNDARIIL